jgi:hypothetical protein
MMLEITPRAAKVQLSTIVLLQPRERERRERREREREREREITR